MFVCSLQALELIEVAFAETVDLVECGVDRSFAVAENRLCKLRPPAERR
jgi:hypothetical protein